MAEIRLSRISKLLIDRDQMDRRLALSRRAAHVVVIRCGGDVAGSRTLQIAALTAASIASRCFPGAAFVELDEKTANAPCLVWAVAQSFGAALGQTGAMRAPPEYDAVELLLGNATPTHGRALRITFDGWIARIGPAERTARAAEREYFAPVGALAGALALSEIFLSFAQVSVQAMRREVGLSLWRPDLDVDDPAALGLPARFFPSEMWLLGLGHLGNAYLWTLSTLPYTAPKDVCIHLLDFDIVEPENYETGLLFSINDVEQLKTRACASWLEERGFRTRIVERRFGADFRRDTREPGLAFSGFDSNLVRQALPAGEFLRVVDTGLGGMTANFDAISLHTLPNPRAPEELWPELEDAEKIAQAEEQRRMAAENLAYASVHEDECGRFDLAGKSVAVPFTGVAAASLAVAESVRMFHVGAPAYYDLRVRLGDIAGRYAGRAADTSAVDVAGLAFVDHLAAPIPDT